MKHGRWATSIERDTQSLSNIGPRPAGSEGERAMLHAVRQLLPDDADARTEPFVDHVSRGLVVALHALLLLAASALGYWFPATGAVLCFALGVSLFGEASGRFGLLRFVIPKSASYNLVVREEGSSSQGTVVVVAPLDARGLGRLDVPVLRRPLQIVLGATLLTTSMLGGRALAEPWGNPTLALYGAAMLVFVVAAVFGAMAHQRTIEPLADASAAVVGLELARRLHARGVDGVDVWVLFAGCSYAYQGGVRAFLRLHGPVLVDPTLILALDEPGRMPLFAAVAEGGLWPEYHRPTGPALVERLRWAGLIVPPADRAGSSNGQAAARIGLRALTLFGGRAEAAPETVGRACDVVELLIRRYGEDLARVATNRPAIEELLRGSLEES